MDKVCAPTIDISVWRNGIPQVEENASTIYSFLEPDDCNITVKQVIDWIICTCPPYDTLVIYISNYPAIQNTVIWSKENGFYMNPNGIFYEEMDTLRQGRAQPSEVKGIYVLMATIK
jgi:hypothetical protein